jgi:aryl-alcohol dehydrogenase-like predicted oxidoreductase
MMTSVGFPVEARRLGSAGPTVFPIALGCMGMTGMYGAVDEQDGVATIHAAMERGVTLIDTGDFYSSGRNELLIGRAIQGHRDKVLLSVKFGGLREPGGGWTGFDARPAAVKNFLAYSLTRLGVDHVDIYRPSRLDPHVPIEDTIGAISQMVKAGYVRYVGLSEVGPETIRRAHAVHPISDLQIEYSLLSRGPEAAIFPLLKELGIGITAYGILSRGLLTGWAAGAQGDYRAALPRFQGANLAANQRLASALKSLGQELGCSPAQLAIAWALAKEPSLVAVVGSRTGKQLGDSLQAAELVLTEKTLHRLEALIPANAVQGTRYGAEQMKGLDSERA